MRCAACGGGNWHCGQDEILPQCPEGAALGSSCSGTPSANVCVACTNGGYGYELSCNPENTVWGGMEVLCSP
jgi:hypothetical protein